MLRFACFCFIFVTFLHSSNLEKLYLDEGIDAVEKVLEKRLKSGDFWADYLKDRDVLYGYYENDTMLVIVNKETKKMQVFDYINGVLKLRLTQDVIVGKDGNKQKEGDLKTPVGIYTITKRFTPPTDFYGPVAFALSYPNLMDKLDGKDGYGIWIHGFPSDGAQREILTRGCVALTNDLLLEFESVVQDKNAVTIISEDKEATSTKQEIAQILSSLYEWKNAWKISDSKVYLSFYDESFKRFDGMRIKQFRAMKKSIFNKKEDKIINFSNLQIIPYPNLENKKMFKIAFHEYYKTKSYKYKGHKELYVKLEDGKMKIIAER